MHLQEQFLNFINKYSKYYDEFELLYLKDVDLSAPQENMPDILRQILTELELIKDEDNAYLQFTNLIEKTFGLEKNIVEIGGGIIPSLSKIIALKQKKGTITVYDPRLIKEGKFNNLILKKDKFTVKTNVSNVSLFIGFMPKNATELIINKACMENKDFIITLCGDGLSDEDSYYEDNEEFLHSMIHTAKNKVAKSNLGRLEYTYLKSLNHLHPVIYNKR